MVTLTEAKLYLVIDHDDDDAMLQDMINASESLVKEVLRVDTLPEDDYSVKIAVLYAIAYMYEHREESDLHSLTLNLRYYLFGIREAAF